VVHSAHVRQHHSRQAHAAPSPPAGGHRHHDGRRDTCFVRDSHAACRQSPQPRRSRGAATRAARATPSVRRRCGASAARDQARRGRGPAARCQPPSTAATDGAELSIIGDTHEAPKSRARSDWTSRSRGRDRCSRSRRLSSGRDRAARLCRHGARRRAWQPACPSSGSRPPGDGPVQARGIAGRGVALAGDVLTAEPSCTGRTPGRPAATRAVPCHGRPFTSDASAVTASAPLEWSMARLLEDQEVSVVRRH